MAPAAGKTKPLYHGDWGVSTFLPTPIQDFRSTIMNWNGAVLGLETKQLLTDFNVLLSSKPVYHDWIYILPNATNILRLHLISRLQPSFLRKTLPYLYLVLGRPSPRSLLRKPITSNNPKKRSRFRLLRGLLAQGQITESSDKTSARTNQDQWHLRQR